MGSWQNHWSCTNRDIPLFVKFLWGNLAQLQLFVISVTFSIFYNLWAGRAKMNLTCIYHSFLWCWWLCPKYGTDLSSSLKTVSNQCRSLVLYKDLHHGIFNRKSRSTFVHHIFQEWSAPPIWRSLKLEDQIWDVSTNLYCHEGFSFPKTDG